MNQPPKNTPPPAARKTFDEWYQEVPPWDIGRPQSEFIKLENEGKLKGKILDVGCGTGENALYLSSQGYEVWGIDFSPTAITKALEKAKTRNLAAHFQVADALKLTDLQQTFDCIIDSGLFHCFSDEERPIFVNQLSKTLTPNGNYYFLCFSDKEVREGGPRRVSYQEITSTFSKGWSLDSVQEVIFENTLHEGGSHGFLVSIKKVAS